MTQALTLVQRAAVALNSSKYELELVELISKTKDLVEIKDNAGRDQIHRAGMTLSNTRIAIAKTGKESREDATQFSKAVIAEEKRLIDLIKPEEDRIFAIRDLWDEKIEAEKQAKIAAERARIEKIKNAIETVRDIPALCIGQSISGIEQILNDLNETGYKDTFYQEYLSEVESVAEISKAKISNMLVEMKQEEAKRIQEQKEREAEVARLKAEREENERVRKELAAQQKLIDDQAKSDRIKQEVEQKIRDEAIKAERQAIENERLVAKQVQDNLNAQIAAFEAEKQKAIDAQNAAVQAEEDKAKFEKEQAEYLAHMQSVIPSPKPAIIADKLIESTVGFINAIEAPIICVGGIVLNKNDILSAISESFDISHQDAEIAINSLFKD